MAQKKSADQIGQELGVAFVIMAIPLLIGALFFILKPKNFARLILWLFELSLLAIFTPAFLLFNLIWASLVTNKKLCKITNTNSDFWLDEKEQREFVLKYNHLCDIENKLSEANQLSRGHRIRNDGRVDERSHAGKRANELNDTYGPMADSAQRAYHEITHRPLRRWQEFNAFMRQRIASLATMAFGGIFLGILGILYHYDQNMIPVEIIRNFNDAGIPLVAAVFRFAMAMFQLNIILVGLYCLFYLIFWNAGKKYSPVPPLVNDDNYCAPWTIAAEMERSESHKEVVDVIIHEEGEENAEDTINKLQKQAAKNLKLGILDKANIASGRALALSCETPKLVKLHKTILNRAMLAVYIPAIFIFMGVMSERFDNNTLFWDPVLAFTLLGSIALLLALCWSFASPAPIWLLVPIGGVIGYISAPRIMWEPGIGAGLYFLLFGIVMFLQFCGFWGRLSLVFWERMVYSAETSGQIIEGLKDNFQRSKFYWVLASLDVIVLLGGVGFSTYYFSRDGRPAEKVYEIGMQYLEGKERPQNTEKGILLITMAAQKEYIPAYYALGQCQLNGAHGVSQDIPQGINNIQKSANAGLPEAQVKLGNCLENGVGIAQNLTDAHMWYDKAAGIDADAKKAAERIANIAQYWTPAHNGDKEAQYNLGLCYAKGDGITKNQETARNWFLKSADQGFPMAQVHVGVWLVNGIGGAKDAAKGIAYCEKAAEQGLGDAYGVLGEYYFDGKVVPKDYGKALKYFTLSAEKGIPVSMFYLGICYNNGFGTEKDAEKAFKYYQQAAEKNIIAAHHALGECYENGIGVIIDYTKALEHYSVAATDKDNWVDTRLGKTRDDSIAGQKRLASIGKSWALANEKNDAQAQCDVGTCYFNGNGVKKDLSSALKWFRKAAAQGNLEGIVRVADCQFYGYGIDTNQAEAIQTYVKAAEQGQPHALFRLGECYEYGTGVEQNLTTAASWYKKAVEQKYNPAMEALKKITRVSNCWDKAVRDNDPAAQLELGKCYWFGDGIPKNQITAFTWFEKSGQQGNGEALHALGICYENGQGTDKNLANAIKFYNESARKEYIPAVFTLAQKYQQGIGVSQNLTTAYELYTRAASAKYKNADEMADQLREIAKYWSPAITKGEPQAQYMLSKCYNSGNGVQRDTQKAREFLEKSAQQNYAAAQFDLAQLLRSEAKSEADDKLIVDWLIKAAANGHVEAQVQLGELYYTGKGVREDYDKAIELWEKAVAQKNVQAMFLLGNYRFTGRGMFNSGKDVDKALELWKSASDLGHVNSSFKLGEYYYGGTGMFGSGKDRKLAYAFYEKAAQGGHVEAMYKFGEGLYDGDDIKRNKTLGIEWLRKAAANGNEAAKRFLDKKKIPLIAPMMTARKTPAAIPQSTPSSSPTAKIDGGMIGVKTAADDAKQRDIAPQLQALIDKWSPEKLVIGKILPVNGEQDRLLEISGAKGNDKKVTVYVEMSFNTNEFYSKLVPEFRELLDIVSTKKQTVSRNFKRTDRGGFWWGNYEQRNKSPYRLQAHVFSPKDMVPKNSSIAVFLRNKGDDFTLYELSQSANIISVLDANKSKIFVVTATFFDKNDKEVVSFSRDITFSTDRIQAYFPLYSNLIVFPMNITGDRLMISPEFSGERNEVEGSDAFNFHEKLVRKVEGIMTLDQLQRVSSVKITFTTR